MKKSLLFAALFFGATFSAHANVSYSDILADPDNVELNQKYAVEQLEAGNAKGALAAIERVLAARPTDLGARLFRARILMALGSDLQADSELQALAKLPLPEAQASMVANMREQIASRRRAWQQLQLLFRQRAVHFAVQPARAAAALSSSSSPARAAAKGVAPDDHVAPFAAAQARRGHRREAQRARRGAPGVRGWPAERRVGHAGRAAAVSVRVRGGRGGDQAEAGSRAGLPGQAEQD